MGEKKRMIAGFPVHPSQNVSSENKQEYLNERRAKELTKRGFNQEAVAGMMNMSEKEATSMINRHSTKEMIVDGTL